MRILWFTVDLFEPFHPHTKGSPSRGSSWQAPLFYSLLQQSDIELGVVTPVLEGAVQKMTVGGATCYTVPITRGSNRRAMSPSLVRRYREVVRDFHPDLIHLHGTEVNFGLLRNHLDPLIPMVCSIQGIITPWMRAMKQSVADTGVRRCRSLKNRMGRGGVDHALRIWRHYSLLEQEIFRINRYFIGRTEWDRAYVTLNSPGAVYFHGEELLRAPFYETRWNPATCEPHRIFVSSSAYPLKGFHLLISAIAMLKVKYPDITLVAPLSSLQQRRGRWIDSLLSEDYDIWLKRMISRYRLQDHLRLTGRLTAAEMADQYRKARLFVLPSFLENSSNALGEAMMVGTPVVVAPVGGIPSIVRDGQSALFFPAGDPDMLAYQIDRLLSDDQLAQDLSRQAREIALQRHHVAATTRQYMLIYADIIAKQKIIHTINEEQP